MTPATLTPVPDGSSLSGDCRLASSAAAHEPAAPAWLEPMAPPGSKRHNGARERMDFKQVGRCSQKPELPAGAARAGLCRRTIEQHVPGSGDPGSGIKSRLPPSSTHSRLRISEFAGVFPLNLTSFEFCPLTEAQNMSIICHEIVNISNILTWRQHV